MTFPGTVFERIYNARSVEKLAAGLFLDQRSFNPQGLRQAIEQVTTDRRFAENARRAGANLLTLGGAARIYEVLESYYPGSPEQAV